MKIEKIDIKKFGPLKNKTFKLSQGLNIFFGENETGKTSMVDLIVRELFKYPKRSGTQDLTPFKGVQRYRDTDFDGDIIISHDGVSYSVSNDRNKPNFEEIFGDILLSRLLCIESGDLSIPKDSNFFECIKEKLSGTIGGIDEIRKTIFANVGLPPSGEKKKGSTFYNEYEEFEENLSKYKELNSKLPNLHELKTALDETKEKLADLNQKRLLNAKRDYQEYKDILKTIPSFKNITEDGLKKLKDLKSSKEKSYVKKDSLEEESAELSLNLDEDEKILDNKKKESKDISEKLNSRQTRELEEDIQNFIIKRGELETKKQFAQASYIGWIAFFLISAISLVYLLLKNSHAFYIPAISLGIGFLLLFFWKGIKSRAGEVNKLKKRIKTQSVELGLPFLEDIENIDLNTIPILRSEIKKLEGEIETLEKSLQKLRDDLTGKKEQIKINIEEIEAIEKKIKERLKDSDVESIESYEVKISELRVLNTSLVQKRESLEKLLGLDESKWSEKTDNVKIAETTEKYDHSMHEQLTKQKDRLEEELDNTKKPFSQIGLENPNEVLIKIGEHEKKLEEMSINYDSAKLCDKILSLIEEERDKVLLKGLSEKTSPIFGYMEKILGAKRIKQIFVENGELKVEMNSEGKFDLPSLSRGTADQLLFSFRLSILKGITKEPHFIILDDPFLSSDYQRRDKLTGILADFIDGGWQVLYFTFDEQIKNLLVKRVKRLEIFNLVV